MTNNEPFDAMNLFDLADELRDRVSQGETVTEATLEEIAVDYSLPISDVYASLAMCPEVSLNVTYPTTVKVCVGRCQFSGGAGLLRSLIELRKEKDYEIGILTTPCLDRCDDAPVMSSQGKSGSYCHPKVKLDELGELIKAIK